MSSDKQIIREKVWQILQEEKAARFPFPLKGRIPNFKGAEATAEKVRSLDEWHDAEVMKINPDAPQKKLREYALLDGKTLLMPTPRLQEGFLLLRNLAHYAKDASSLKGASKHGQKVDVQNIPAIDFIINSCVAVSEDGSRLGKGHGYGELEYGILRELGKVHEQVPIVTTVHELQIQENIPQETHDVTVDVIVTPERIIRINGQNNKPQGIYWERITSHMLQEMPVLDTVQRIVEKG